MSTEIEKYLKNNRSLLDVESPDDNRIWEGISGRTGKHKSIEKNPRGRSLVFTRIRNIAAVIIMLFSLTYITNDIIQDKKAGKMITLNQIDRDLGEREKEYRNLVNYKEGELSSYDVPDNELIREIFSEIKNQDAIYAQALKDLREMGNDDQVINIIFNTYERKIQLLGLIIIETNKQINYEKDTQNSL